jgi:transposase
LSDRAWVCRCGAEHQRDANAACNLLAAMHAST